ncbi:MAG: histidine phosphatase family protein [Chloroflexota bacterium]
MQLYIIRHGQSYNNALWAKNQSENGRLADPHLTEIGEKQAEHLARYVAETDRLTPPDGAPNAHNRFGYHFTHLYTSLMLRAVQTGAPLAEALAMPLLAWPIIHEWGGIMGNDAETGAPIPQPGLDRAYFAKHFSGLVLPPDLGDEGWWGKRPFEPRENSYHRAKQFIHQLLQRHDGTDDRVALVTHGGFTGMMLQVIFNTQESNTSLRAAETQTWLVSNNTSITRLDFEEDRILMMYQNRLDHLPANLITY